MEKENKAKVVASVWGAEFIKFLAAQAVVPPSIWKKRLNSSYPSKSTKLHYCTLSLSQMSSGHSHVFRPDDENAVSVR